MILFQMSPSTCFYIYNMTTFACLFAVSWINTCNIITKVRASFGATIFFSLWRRISIYITVILSFELPEAASVYYFFPRTLWILFHNSFECIVPYMLSALLTFPLLLTERHSEVLSITAPCYGSTGFECRSWFRRYCLRLLGFCPIPSTKDQDCS
jgi:hypothetical protein